MYAAIEAAREGCTVLLADRSLIGRGGATVMAQMTVAAAIGEEVPDHWHHHFDDTIAAGHGLCDETLARLLCEEGPDCIRQMDEWGVGWARRDGHIAQAMAPGHDRPRCVYVDFLNTGPAVSKTLRASSTASARSARPAICASSIWSASRGGGRGGRISSRLGHAGRDRRQGDDHRDRRADPDLPPQQRLGQYGRRRVRAGLRAGARLVDMEFVQFFPIGHLAPRLIGMDPIMWDPFRYKLGGRLLNSKGEEFAGRYGRPEDGTYVQTRDVATYGILKEVEAGRGSPHGGVYLSFPHCSESDLRDAFGPVIDRLAANRIDLTKMPVEVAPIAHYHMGGIVVDAQMRTDLPGLFAAGEAVGGANGANRLSGNAVTEALVFGRRAGQSAAKPCEADDNARRGAA